MYKLDKVELAQNLILLRHHRFAPIQQIQDIVNIKGNRRKTVEDLIEIWETDRQGA